MKLIATLATFAVLAVPSVSAAACSWHDKTAQISCADGQIYDEATQRCVPQTS